MIFPKPAAVQAPASGTPQASSTRPPQKDKNELPLKKDQEVLVQVVKDPFGTKGARLTTHISLAGRFVVYMPVDKHSGISKKIDKPQERQRLRDILKTFTFAKSGGFIIRTASMEQGEKEIFRDSKFFIWMLYSDPNGKKTHPFCSLKNLLLHLTTATTLLT